jgi:hypothetical protein
MGWLRLYHFSGENESLHVLQNLYGAPVYYTVLSLKWILKYPTRKWR